MYLYNINIYLNENNDNLITEYKLNSSTFNWIQYKYTVIDIRHVSSRDNEDR